MLDPEDKVPLSELGRKELIVDLSEEETPEESPLIRRSKWKMKEPKVRPAKRTRLARNLEG